MDNNKKYLNIPLPMLKDLHTRSKQFFDDIFDVGVFLQSKTLVGTDEKRYKDALHFLGVTQGSSVHNAVSNAKTILSRLPSKYPTTGIEKEMYFDYYKNYKDEFEIICLSAFLGSRSILGKKPYCKTNKNFIHARMFGYTTVKQMSAELTPIEKKYKTRRMMDKVLNELEMNWYLKILSNHQRGMIISFDLSYDELALIIEKQKQQTKIQQITEAKRKAIRNAKK